MSDKEYVIGLDIGGTGIKGALVDRDGNAVLEQELPTEAAKGREHIAAQTELLLLRLMDEGRKVRAIGIGSAGRINTDTGKVVYATDNLPGWHGFELGEWVSTRFHLPTAVDNDVNAAALGEAWAGAGRGVSSLFLLAMGTGVGGGIIHKGEVVRGSTWSAGEIGHMVLYPEGDACNCGQKGCIEAYLSGTALVRIASQAAAKSYSHGREVLADYIANDPSASRVVHAFASNLATVLFNIRNFYDPELILLGGGVSQARDVWEKPLQEALDKLPADIPLGWAELGNRAGYIGGAKLAWELLERGDAR